MISILPRNYFKCLTNSMLKNRWKSKPILTIRVTCCFISDINILTKDMSTWNSGKGSLENRNCQCFISLWESDSATRNPSSLKQACTSSTDIKNRQPNLYILPSCLITKVFIIIQLALKWKGKSYQWTWAWLASLLDISTNT